MGKRLLERIRGVVCNGMGETPVVAFNGAAWMFQSTPAITGG